MAIRQLTPTIRKLGALRLCRDDLAEILVQIGKLDNVTITIEADHSELDDLETDMPKLGKRLKYLTIKAVRSRSSSLPGITTATDSTSSVVDLDPPLDFDGPAGRFREDENGGARAARRRRFRLAL